MPRSLFLSVFVLASFGAVAHAATFAHYAFNGATFADSAGNVDVTATDLLPGAAAATDDGFSTFSTPVDGGSHSLFLRGASLNTTNNSTSAAFVEATTDGNYLEFTITSAIGMNLDTLSFDTAKNAGNAHSFRVLFTSDIGGHVFDDRLDITSPSAADTSLANVIQSNLPDNIGDAPAGTGSDWGIADNASVDLSGPAYQGINSATFRVYGFTIANATPSTQNVLRFDNIMVSGTLVPEPSASLLALFAGAVAFLRRRR